MARVLLMVEDQWIQTTVSAVLVSVGHQVLVAATAEEALLAAQRATPDLVITGAAGPALISQLRAQPGLHALPALFLIDGSTSLQGFRPDLDHPFALPVRSRALENKLATLLGRARTPVHLEAEPATPPPPSFTVEEPDPSSRSALTGHLAHFSLSSVLSLLELDRKSGILHVLCGPLQGKLVLRDGRIIRAQVDGPTPHAAAHAVYELLTWNEGRFQFNVCAVIGQDEIGSPTSFLLMEGARLVDERNHAKAQN